MKVPITEMLARLPLPTNGKWKDGVWDFELHKKGKVRMIVFAPRAIDHQTRHDEDENYFIVSGSGDRLIDDERLSLITGDVFLVPSNVPRR